MDLQPTVVSLSTWSKDIERQRDELVRAQHPLTPFLTHETQSRGRLHRSTRMAFTRAWRSHEPLLNQAATGATRDAELALMRCKLAALGPQVEALQKINFDGQIAIMAIMA